MSNDTYYLRLLASHLYAVPGIICHQDIYHSSIILLSLVSHIFYDVNSGDNIFHDIVTMLTLIFIGYKVLTTRYYVPILLWIALDILIVTIIDSPLEAHLMLHLSTFVILDYYMMA